MWNDVKDKIVMVAEWDDEDVDKDEAGHMIDFIKSIKELNDAMQPFKDQLKDLKQNYKEQEWLDAKQQKMAMKIYRMIDDDIDLAEFVDLYQAVNKIERQLKKFQTKKTLKETHIKLPHPNNAVWVPFGIHIHC